MTTTDRRDATEATETPRWRVGEHYGIHVYEGDRPVATFHRAEDAARAVAAVNASPARSCCDSRRGQRHATGCSALAAAVQGEGPATEFGHDHPDPCLPGCSCGKAPAPGTDTSGQASIGLDVVGVYTTAYNGGHRDGIRTAAKLLAGEYRDRADLLTGDARQAMRDAATVAQNVVDNAPPGSAPARGEWPIAAVAGPQRDHDEEGA